MHSNLFFVVFMFKIVSNIDCILKPRFTKFLFREADYIVDIWVKATKLNWTLRKFAWWIVH